MLKTVPFIYKRKGCAVLLTLRVEEGFVRYVDGPSLSSGPTRYAGEYWDRIASDLLCGVADVFQDVGIVILGKTSDANSDVLAAAGDRRWVNIADARGTHKSIWSLSEANGLILVPSNRESVEEAMGWTTPYMRKDGPSESALSVAFPHRREFRDELASRTWDEGSPELKTFMAANCTSKPLFSMRWGQTVWTLYPGTITVGHLVKLADPVVSRINCVISD
jgi:hypothetical protein